MFCFPNIILLTYIPYWYVNHCVNIGYLWKFPSDLGLNSVSQFTQRLVCRFVESVYQCEATSLEFSMTQKYNKPVNWKNTISKEQVLNKFWDGSPWRKAERVVLLQDCFSRTDIHTDIRSKNAFVSLSGVKSLSLSLTLPENGSRHAALEICKSNMQHN